MYTEVEDFLRQVKIKQASSPKLLDNETMVNRYNHMAEELSEFAHSNNMSDLDGCVDAGCRSYPFVLQVISSDNIDNLIKSITN